MENLAQLVDCMREYMIRTNTQVHFNLPQIVVVGEQSSGKSSVLESIVEREFLPKGSGIVTRRPILIQLIFDKNVKEYGEFMHIPTKKFENLNEISSEITNNTNLLLGNDQNISKEPIVLKIYSPKVVNLTLIDLPGLTKIPVGDQPNNISEKIYKIVSDFISNPHCIIVAVIAANTDVVNSDALKLTKKFDPLFKRTIGVLTKVDLMDRGTNCLAVLQNQVIPLSLGWVGVVNRSYTDTVQGKSIHECVEREKLFFLHHPVYRKIAYRCGIKHLQKVMQETLKSYIKKCVPILRDSINDQLRECNDSIKKMELCMGIGGEMDEANIIIHTVKEFVFKMKENMGTSYQSLGLEKVSLGVIIQKILQTVFIEEYKNAQYNNDQYQNIKIGIENADGIPGYVEMPDVVIRSVVKINIDLMMPCIFKVIKMVKEKLFECVQQSLTTDCPFPNLNDSMKLLCDKFVNEATTIVLEKIQYFIGCERSHINFRHPDFIKCPTLDGINEISTNSFRNENGLLKSSVEIDDKNFKSKCKTVIIILEGTNVSMYKKNIDHELIGTFSVQGCKIRSIESNLTRIAFTIYHKKNKYVVNQMKTLDLKFKNEEIMVTWKERLLELMLTGEDKYNSEKAGIESILQIEKINLLVEKYTQIVMKNIHDLTIKICHLSLIFGLENFIQNEMTYQLVSTFKTSELLLLDEKKKNILLKLKSKKKTLHNFVEMIEHKLINRSNT